MADQIAKFLTRLNAKQYVLVTNLLKRIAHRDLEGLDCKPLKGHKDLYRVRKGRMRVIFYMRKDEIRFIQVSERDDRTYRDY